MIVGDATVGKSSILAAFSIDRFENAYVPTLYDNDLVGRIDINLKHSCFGFGRWLRLRPNRVSVTVSIIDNFSNL